VNEKVSQSALWVPKTCATWPDALLAAGHSAPRQAVRAGTYATCADVLHLVVGSVSRLVPGHVGGAGLAEGAMILGLWA
jgi:hypothetical protein